MDIISYMDHIVDYIELALSWTRVCGIVRAATFHGFVWEGPEAAKRSGGLSSSPRP